MSTEDLATGILKLLVTAIAEELAKNPDILAQAGREQGIKNLALPDGVEVKAQLSEQIDAQLKEKFQQELVELRENLMSIAEEAVSDHSISSDDVNGLEDEIERVVNGALENQERTIDSDDVDGLDSAISSEVENYFDNNIQEAIESNIEEAVLGNEEIVNHLVEKVSAAITKDLTVTVKATLGDKPLEGVAVSYGH
jgi:hypothetical protein